MKPQVEIYDTTLRDGSRGEGINFSLADKLRIAERLDVFGIPYIEGGWPGSNPKDLEFFQQAICSFSLSDRNRKQTRQLFKSPVAVAVAERRRCGWVKASPRSLVGRNEPP